ncbi:hypothetical protein F0U62_05730 [Cystobacter fuscus]|uniref:hypothetical protein n=1 Tax=Cystobacter fuscus TaxID=43 RepID=UPI002B3218BE|nr:hypothetical protein F0U62_05730 [Cystobacter fuscus]
MATIVVIRVDPADATVAYVRYVKARDDDYTVHASNLDFTGAHPQFANNRDGCGLASCMGSHHLCAPGELKGTRMTVSPLGRRSTFMG